MLIPIILQRFSREKPMFVCVFAKKFPRFSLAIMLLSLSSQAVGEYEYRLLDSSVSKIARKEMKDAVNGPGFNGHVEIYS